MKLPHTFLRRLTAILACLNRKPSLAILSHVYFTPVGPNILITASDLDLHLHWPLPTATFGTLRTTLARSPKRKETRVTFHLDPDGLLRADIYTSSGQNRTDLVDAHFPAGKHVIDLRQKHFSIAFDASLLLSALATTGHRLRFTDDISPILIGDPVQGEAVLMPLRIADPATVNA